MSRSSAQRKHDLTADACQKALVKLIQSFSHGHHLHSVFSDFVELCALAISNSVDRTQFEVREKRYLDIVGKYKREEVDRFPEMLGLLTESLELRVQAMGKAGASGSAMVSGGLTDVLGETYMMLELGNARAGQFFTPYHVSRLMAMMTIGDGGAAVREAGFMRLQEPACGAGGMVIAAAESLHDAGLNYQQAMHATCVHRHRSVLCPYGLRSVVVAAHPGNRRSWQCTHARCLGLVVHPGPHHGWMAQKT